MELFTSRLSEEEPLDMVADKILLDEVSKGEVVIDSWSLPWLSSLGTKIYLDASLETRAKRVAIRGGMNYELALEVVAFKDEETRKLFKRVYGFDIKKDHEVFDYILDVNKLSVGEVFEKVNRYVFGNISTNPS